MSEDANAAERTNTRPSSVPRYSSSETSRVGTLAYLVVAVLFFATAWPVSKIGLAGAPPPALSLVRSRHLRYSAHQGASDGLRARMRRSFFRLASCSFASSLHSR